MRPEGQALFNSESSRGSLYAMFDAEPPQESGLDQQISGVEEVESKLSPFGDVARSLMQARRAMAMETLRCAELQIENARLRKLLECAGVRI